MTIDEVRARKIVEKADYVRESLEVLSEKQPVEFSEYRERRDVSDVVERRFVTMTQACVDIARMVLSDLDAPQPEANGETMWALERAGVLTEGTATRMDEACGLRNVLAHEYGRVIDDRVVYDALHDLQRYRDFVVEVRDFLREEDVL